MVLLSIMVLVQESRVEVKYLVDGDRTHYEVYGKEQKNRFLAEVDGAEQYVAILGW